MKCRLIKKSECTTSNWRGGKTTEIAIFPETKKYIDRDFIWRLSSATVELEETDFTKLPDYDRILLPLEGEVVLSFNDEKTVKLKELEQTSFSGGWKTKSFGKITDFNLMTRKDISKGEVDIICPTGEAKPYSVWEDGEHGEKEKITHAIFCRDGYTLVSIGGSSYMVGAGDSLIIEFDADENIGYSLMGEGHSIRAMVRYEYDAEESEAVYIPPEKVSFDDFKCAFFLANTQFRFADRIFKRIRETWYDEVLSGAIKKLEKMYVTFLISIIGLMAIIMTVFDEGMSDIKLLLIIFSWFAFDIAVISPVIYLIFLPKPIRKHIKDISSLTPYEKAVREKELSGNERIEKLMKKYKNSGKKLASDREEKR